MTMSLRTLIAAVAIGSCLPLVGCEVKVDNDDGVLEPAGPDRKVDVDIDVDRK